MQFLPVFLLVGLPYMPKNESLISQKLGILNLSSKGPTKPSDGHVDGALLDPEGGGNGPLHGVDVLRRAGHVQPALLVGPADGGVGLQVKVELTPDGKLSRHCGAV